ncbi:MAG: hypothetical protein V7459_15870 [Oceanicoccus sp.]
MARFFQLDMGTLKAWVLSPRIILCIPEGFGLMLDIFLGSDEGAAQKQSFELAFEHFPWHLLFGAGEK